MPLHHLLLITAKAELRQELAAFLQPRGLEVASALGWADSQELLLRQTVDLVLLDATAEEESAFEILRDSVTRPSQPLVVVLVPAQPSDAAVRCLQHGAFDVLPLPWSAAQLELTLLRAERFSTLRKVTQLLNHDADPGPEPELMGASPAADQLRQIVRSVARTQATVLIQGEPGTGQEIVARALVRQSPRAQGPCIHVDCARFPEALIESEIFGRDKEPVTPPGLRPEGRLLLAQGGTLILEEISHLPLRAQTRLLRFLQQHDQPTPPACSEASLDLADVRVVATTSRSLADCCARREFRQDLHLRVGVMPINLPPLRDRRDDIPALIDRTLQQSGRKYGKHIRGVTPDCLSALQAHPWPGNLHELKTVVERAVILCPDNGRLEVHHLNFVLGSALTEGLDPATSGSVRQALAQGESAADRDELLPLAEMAKRHILAALERTHDNRTHAARLLGISIRTLRNKLNEYGVKSRDYLPAGKRA